MSIKKYILITPARNEEAYIERTLEAVCKQTILPLKWVIVNDGSTDSTETIVKKYASKHLFIELVNLGRIGSANFGSKVKAFDAGYNYIKKISYDFIGNLDSDVSFESSYFESILHEFEKDRELGIAGGIIQELIHNKYVTQNISTNSVAGAVQLFRKDCYAGIGGYLPMEYGGIDAAAEILARMDGWKVKTFSEYKVLHHRRVKTGKKNITTTRFYQGITNYMLGYHPVFHVMSTLTRIKERPFFIGSVASIGGYFWAYFQRESHRLPESAVKYLREEQIRRMRLSIISGKRK